MPFRRTLVPILIALGAAPTRAQDIQPVFDLPTMAQGQVIGATARAQAARDARRRQPTPDQITACAQRPRFRRQYGPDNPKLRQLEGLCRGVGL
ncbi:MAG: hypothetical protein PGN09_02905 [Sphingomonas fennica]